MNLRESAQQSLDLLQEIHVGNMTPMAENNWDQAITALRAALAEATIKDNLTVEPVAWVRVDRGHIDFHKHPDYLPLYTTLPQRKPLTDEEIRRIDDATPFHEDVEWEVRFARAIERAHGIGGEE